MENQNEISHEQQWEEAILSEGDLADTIGLLHPLSRSHGKHTTEEFSKLIEKRGEGNTPESVVKTTADILFVLEDYEHTGRITDYAREVNFVVDIEDGTALGDQKVFTDYNKLAEWLDEVKDDIKADFILDVSVPECSDVDPADDFRFDGSEMRGHNAASPYHQLRKWLKNREANIRDALNGIDFSDYLDRETA